MLWVRGGGSYLWEMKGNYVEESRTDGEGISVGGREGGEVRCVYGDRERGRENETKENV